MSTTEHLAHFDIAGFTYYQGAKCFRKLHIGRKLEFRLEKDNKYDPRAVAIYYKEDKLGFVPRTENRIIYKMLTVGLDKALEVRVQTVDATEHPEHQIGVVVHLVN